MSRVLALVFVAASSIGVASHVSAQSATRPQFGAIGGVNFSSVTNNADQNLGIPGIRVDAKRRTGFQIGAYYTQLVSEYVSIQPEVHYIQKGAEFEGAALADPSQTGSIGTKLAYVEVPVLLRADFTKGNGIRPFVVAGPSFAYNVSCTSYVKNSTTDLSSDCDTSAQADGSDSPFKKFDVGGIVGGGLAAVMSGRSVSVQVRYSRGFTRITKDSANDYSPKNTGISVLLGIGI